ncbi:hypothetical protein Ga0074812_103227 [Parafrankia irregularis]|uniref:Uncharacterized protein n=1 Tax=Parafrankia irregularis TaxID=795642 RepID=A0A0S4QGN9_9ACTN|nr:MULTISPECIES: DUF6232 family protein [Parafrankia]MBE3200868.1 hypothetical protein [Parafrankia sp. CH37]CUU54737.1 hypothetical protein Ga0074812_103227 [Parafrankia irregularis]
MAKKNQIFEIVVGKRALTIGHEVYPLANISRIQTRELKWFGKYSTFYPLRRMASLAGGVALLVVAVIVGPRYADPDGEYALEDIGRQFAVLVLVLAGAATLWLSGVLIYRVFFRRTYYLLLLETAGAQAALLNGTDLKEIMRIRNALVAAIEDPPASAYNIEVHGDVFAGDKFTGRGYNVNKSGRGAGQ